MANNKKINDVTPREAETKEEKMLLGFLNQELERISWGKITIEVTVRNGKMVHIGSSEVSRSFNLGTPTS